VARFARSTVSWDRERGVDSRDDGFVGRTGPLEFSGSAAGAFGVSKGCFSGGRGFCRAICAAGWQEAERVCLPTRLSRYATLGRIKRLAYQEEPNRLIWAVLEDGSLVSFTYERAEEVTAWATHPLSGTGVEVESVASMPSLNADEDEVWLTVKRTIDGQTRRSIEVLQHYWDEEETLATAVFVDSAVSYSGSAATQFYGLLHLIGETVKVFADGAPVVGQVVDADGSITLDVAASTLVVGLPIVSRFRSMRPDFGGSALKSGTAQGYKKRTRRFALRVVESGQGIFYGPNFDRLDEFPFRESLNPMDATVPLYSGDTGYRAFPGGFDLDGHICLYFDEPLPCTIAATFAKMQSEENE
jgi:hypothetical protein